MAMRNAKISSTRSFRNGRSHFSRGSSARFMDYQDEMMEAYGGSYNYDFGVVEDCAPSLAMHMTSTDDEENENNLGMLISAFPTIEPSIVQDIFIAKNFDVCGTAEALSGLLPPQEARDVSPPAPPSMESQLVLAEDEDWSFEGDEVESVGSVEWVVVQDEWDVTEHSMNASTADANASDALNANRSYSDVLLAPYDGSRKPFVSTISSTSTRFQAQTPAPSLAKREHDVVEESLCDDYYGIKEHGQRMRHIASRRQYKPKAATSGN